MKRLLTAILLVAGLAAAQTTTDTYTALTLHCNNLAGCVDEPYSHSPVGWAYVTYQTGLTSWAPDSVFSGEPITILTGDGAGHDITYQFSNLAGTLTGPGTADGSGMWTINAVFTSDTASGSLIRYLYRHKVQMGRGSQVWQVVDFGGSLSLTH